MGPEARCRGHIVLVAIGIGFGGWMAEDEDVSHRNTATRVVFVLVFLASYAVRRCDIVPKLYMQSEEENDE